MPPMTTTTAATTRPHTMFRQLSLALATGLLLAGATHGNAQAATLIDTGTPDNSQFAGAVDGSNFLALQFTAAQAWQIDGISTFLAGGQPGEHFSLSLYRESAGHLPGELIASTAVSFAADGWNGATALGWQLPTAGRYWLGLEGVDGSFNAPTGGLRMPGATAFADGSRNGAYQAYAGLQFGLQMTGAVPEPASIALLLAGLLVVGTTAKAKQARRSLR